MTDAPNRPPDQYTNVYQIEYRAFEATTYVCEVKLLKKND